MTLQCRRFLASCILAVSFSASITHGGESSAVVFRADFNRTEDVNADGWPDGWRRRTDREHPAYTTMQFGNRSPISAEELQAVRRSLTQWSLAWSLGKLPGDIVPESPPPAIDRFLEKTIADGCFEIRTNGGGAQIESPSFPVNAKNSYRVGADWSCEFANPYTAKLLIVWLDESETTLGEVELRSTSATIPWAVVTLDETQSIPPSTRFARIRLSIKPDSPKSIHSTVRLDRLCVERIPRVELIMNPELRIVPSGRAFQVQCHLNEIDPATTRIRLVAVDHNGVEAWKLPFRTPEREDASSERASLTWDASIPEPGFYRIEAQVECEGIARLKREISVAVLEKSRMEQKSTNDRIGLSVPQLGNVIKPDRLPDLLDFTNAGAVKFSVWLSDDKSPHSRNMGWMVERLGVKGVQSVGVVDPPSAALQAQFPDQNGSRIATLLDFPKTWQPLLDPVWRKTTLYLTQYQIGWDDDTSMEGHSRRQANLAAVSKHLRTSGGEGKLTIPWGGLADPPTTKATSRNEELARVLLRTEPGLTGAELDTYSRQPTTMPEHNWLSLKPLNRSTYSLRDRVHDLAGRMVVAHMHRWETTWFSDIHDDATGIMQPNGGPSDLFLPTANLTAALSQSTDFQEVTLADNLTAFLFRVGSTDRLLLLGNKADDVGLYLGNNWTAIDVWGRNVPIQDRTVSGIATRFIRLEDWPIIISNVDRSLIQWQQDVVIENSTIENRVGLSEPVRVKLFNPAGQHARGTLAIVAPSLLQDQRADTKFSVPSNKSATVEVPMKLRYDAGQNQEPIDIVVNLDDRPTRQFLVRRQLLVGLKDFQVESHIERDEYDNLSLTLEMFNLGLEVGSFECTLVIPGRRREKFQLLHIRDRAEKRMLIAGGAELRGQTLLLRCEEIGTTRVINHRIAIE